MSELCLQYYPFGSNLVTGTELPRLDSSVFPSYTMRRVPPMSYGIPHGCLDPTTEDTTTPASTSMTPLSPESYDQLGLSTPSASVGKILGALRLLNCGAPLQNSVVDHMETAARKLSAKKGLEYQASELEELVADIAAQESLVAREIRRHAKELTCYITAISCGEIMYGELAIAAEDSTLESKSRPSVRAAALAGFAIMHFTGPRIEGISSRGVSIEPVVTSPDGIDTGLFPVGMNTFPYLYSAAKLPQ